MVQHFDIRKSQKRRNVVVRHFCARSQTDQGSWRGESRSRAPHCWLYRGLTDGLVRIFAGKLAQASQGIVKVACSVPAVSRCPVSSIKYQLTQPMFVSVPYALSRRVAGSMADRHLVSTLLWPPTSPKAPW